MGHEIELKFQVPAGRLAGLRRAVGVRGASRQGMAARYFDTGDDRLAGARCALRLRREGDAWVQTLKAEGALALQRLEHNVALAEGAEPQLDITRHDGTPAGQRLRQVLAAGALAPLTERYRTEIQRTRRRLRHRGAVLELALDEGVIAAGDARLPVCELEIELIDGPADALLDLAARWSTRHGLWLDVRSKSERGQALASGAAAAAAPVPGRPRPPRLHDDMAPATAAAALLAPVLRVALAHASVLADGGGGPEHLHQLRVALRRLQALFKGLGLLWPANLAGTVATQLAHTTGRLGASRDADVMAQTLGPVLQAAGAPAIAWGAGQAVAAEPVTEVLRHADTQRLWLQLLRLAWPPAEAGSPADPLAVAVDPPPPSTLTALLAPPVVRLARQVRRGAARAETLDDAALHRLRRRIKRLRYLLDGSRGLWPRKKALRRLLRRLARVQDALGVLNDLRVAADHCRALAAHDPQAWFAVGWLAARSEAQRLAVVRPLRRLARCKGWPFGS